MSTTTHRAPNGQNLVPHHPHVRRRDGTSVGVAAPPAEEQSPPPAFEGTADHGGGIYAHSPRTASGRRRWNFPAALLEIIPPGKLAEWDAAEDALGEIAGHKVVVCKYQFPVGTKTQKTWCKVGTWDDREGHPSNGDPAVHLTEETLISKYGAGNYQFLVYFVTLDGNGEPEQRLTRSFNQGIGIGDETAPAPPQAQLSAAPAAPPQGAVPFMPPMPFGGPMSAMPFAGAMPSMPGMPPMPMPQVSNYQEWFAVMQMMQQFQAAQAAAAKAAAEEAEAKVARERQRKLDDLEYRQRVEDFDRARAKARRDEEADEQRRRDAEEDKRRNRAHQLALDAAELARTQRADGAADPVKYFEQQQALIERAKDLFGGSDEKAPKGALAAVMQIAEALKPLGEMVTPVIKHIVSDQQMTAKQKIAELELQLRAAQAQAIYAQHPPRAVPPSPAVAPPAAEPPKQHADARIEVRPVATPPPAAPVEPAPAAPPVVAEVKAADDPTLKPGDVIAAPDELPEGAPCPACGGVEECVNGCNEYEAAEDDDGEECDQCPECPHGDDAPTDDDGNCKLCPPCPHGDEDESDATPTAAVELTPPNIAIAPAVAQLPPIGGFVGK